MNWREKAEDAERLIEQMGPPHDIPFDELAEHGIILDPKFPLPPGPTTLKLVKVALESRIEIYRALLTGLFPTE